jgi:chromosome segregation ATPase
MVERDRYGRIIIDFTKDDDADIVNLSILDERYLFEDFKHAVDIKFKSLPNAVSAENFVMAKYNSLVRSLTELYGVSAGIDPAVDINLTSTQEFFSSLGNLIDTNSDSLASQKQKVKVLEQELEQINLANKETNDLIYVQSNEIVEITAQLQEKEKEIELLKQSIAALSETFNVSNT